MEYTELKRAARADSGLKWDSFVPRPCLLKLVTSGYIFLYPINECAAIEQILEWQVLLKKFEG